MHYVLQLISSSFSIMLAKDISSTKKIGTCIYSRNNPQKSPRRIYYCASIMARPLRNCTLSIFMIHVHNYWLLFSSWFLFGSAVSYFVETVVSWRTLALIGIFRSLFLLYKTEYNCSINWILINFICRNYSMSITAYRFIIIPESPRWLENSVQMECITLSNVRLTSEASNGLELWN